ncbi:MAG: hypothetical protein JXA67_21580 [Micromonosporaceae bacterium]|nr:hypothetical protein [Micromonosporaceae bacterium]
MDGSTHRDTLRSRESLRWLIGAAGCIVVALALGVPGGAGPVVWAAGWLLGGFLGVGLLAAFTLADSRERASCWYTVRPAVFRLRTACVVGAFCAVALNAWRFADWASRQ